MVKLIADIPTEKLTLYDFDPDEEWVKEEGEKTMPFMGMAAAALPLPTIPEEGDTVGEMRDEWADEVFRLAQRLRGALEYGSYRSCQEEMRQREVNSRWRRDKQEKAALI